MSAHTSVPRPADHMSLLVGFQLGWLQHAAFRLHRFDVVNQLRPAVETVLARERVLRRGQARRWIGGAQRVEMFLGLLAELLERTALA